MHAYWWELKSTVRGACEAVGLSTQLAVGTVNPATQVEIREESRASVVFTLHTFLVLFSRELIEMLAISRNQKLLQSGEENQVSGFFLN